MRPMLSDCAHVAASIPCGCVPQVWAQRATPRKLAHRRSPKARGGRIGEIVGATTRVAVRAPADSQGNEGYATATDSSANTSMGKSAPHGSLAENYCSNCLCNRTNDRIQNNAGAPAEIAARRRCADGRLVELALLNATDEEVDKALAVEREGQQCAADRTRKLLHERRWICWANRVGE